MGIMVVLTLLLSILSGVGCSRYDRLETRLSLIERKQFYDSMAFRDDIKSLLSKVNNISNDVVDHVDTEEQRMAKDDVNQLVETVKAVSRGFAKEKQYFRSVMDDVNAKLSTKEEHCINSFMSIKRKLEEGFNNKIKVACDDTDLKVRLNYTVSLLETLSDKHDETQTMNMNVLEQMATLGEMLDKVVSSLSLMDSKIGSLEIKVLCGTWKVFGSSCYYVGTSALSFDEASAECEKFNARLAEIESEDENRFITEIAKVETMGAKDSGAWVGGTDRERDGIWTWYKSKAPVAFTAWKHNEPNGKTRENCLHLYRQSQWLWNDSSCSNKMSYICEKRI